jgi:hypothetical protein
VFLIFKFDQRKGRRSGPAHRALWLQISVCSLVSPFPRSCVVCENPLISLRGFGLEIVDAFFGAPNTQKEPAAVLSGQARTVRGLGPDSPRPGAGARFSCLTAGRSAPWGRTVRALGPDGPRVCRGGGRSPAAPGSRSREGPRRGGEILGVV